MKNGRSRGNGGIFCSQRKRCRFVKFVLKGRYLHHKDPTGGFIQLYNHIFMDIDNLSIKVKTTSLFAMVYPTFMS